MGLKMEGLMKVELLNYTPVDVLAEATAIPYQSKATNTLVAKVFESNHRSVARHGMASFSVKGISQSLLRQVSRHPHINLTVKSSRYCDMGTQEMVIPPFVEESDVTEYTYDCKHIKDLYNKWNDSDKYSKEQQREISKMFIPLSGTTDLIISGNYQALFEFLQLRLCVRTEWELRNLSIKLAKILKEKVPEIFKTIGCRGDEYHICPEASTCGKYPSRRVALNEVK